MEEKTVEIVLGGKTFPVKSPFTFKQLRVIEPAYQKYKTISREAAESYDTVAEILVVALREETPEFARSTLDGMRVTPLEVGQAFVGVMRAAGIFREPKPEDGTIIEGEAQGKAEPSIGDTSTAS